MKINECKDYEFFMGYPHGVKTLETVINGLDICLAQQEYKDLCPYLIVNNNEFFGNCNKNGQYMPLVTQVYEQIDIYHPDIQEAIDRR